MIPYAEALARIEALSDRDETQTVPLAAAAGRFLADAVRLAQDQPSFDRATMDGYAIALPAHQEAVRVVATVTAGSTFTGTLRPGEAVRIMTGAPCPPQTTVVPSELVREEATSGGTTVLVPAEHRTSVRNIARRGEDGQAGEVVLVPGTRLSPVALATAAMCGRRTLQVAIPRPWRIITTGDEVGADAPGGIADSNGPYLDGLAHALGVPSSRTHCADARAPLEEALRTAARTRSLVITTGGVSGSATDLVPAAAAAAGFITVFHHVAMQPGKPVLCARHPEGAFLMGLPGNAVSVLATSHLLLLALWHRLLGAPSPSWWALPLATDRQGGRRQQFLPARLTPAGVAVVPWNGSGDLIAAAAGEGLVDIPQGATLAAGTTVRFLPYIGAMAGGSVQLPASRPAR